MINPLMIGCISKEMVITSSSSPNVFCCSNCSFGPQKGRYLNLQENMKRKLLVYSSAYFYLNMILCQRDESPLEEPALVAIQCLKFKIGHSL